MSILQRRIRLIALAAICGSLPVAALLKADDAKSAAPKSTSMMSMGGMQPAAARQHGGPSLRCSGHRTRDRANEPRMLGM